MHDDRAHPGRLDNPEVSHETTDLPLNGLLVFLGCTVVFAVVIHVVIYYFMLALGGPGVPLGGAARPFVAEPGTPPPGPQFERLLDDPGAPIQQVNPAEELRRFRAQEAATLRSWGWQDSPDGPQVPVERALEVLEPGGASPTSPPVPER